MTEPAGTFRVGQGIDVHRFSDDPTRRLVLGGVVIGGSGIRGLDGHSDADVVAHAIADAVLGAAGLGDLGRHAPDTDPTWAGADSLDILARVVELAGEAGWSPVNADCTVVAEAAQAGSLCVGDGGAAGQGVAGPGQREGHPGRRARSTGSSRGHRLHRGGPAAAADHRCSRSHRVRGERVSPAAGGGRGRGGSPRGGGARGGDVRPRRTASTGEAGPHSGRTWRRGSGTRRIQPRRSARAPGFGRRSRPTG